jgi:copper chaperone CopZ
MRIDRGSAPATVAAVVRALQRVPGVLTVDVHGDEAKAVVAHDAGVPIAALLAAANQSGFAARVERAASATAAPVETGSATSVAPHPYVAAVGLAAMLVVIFIDFALPNSPDKRWLIMMPVFLLWAFVVLRATRARRS